MSMCDLCGYLNSARWFYSNEENMLWGRANLQIVFKDANPCEDSWYDQCTKCTHTCTMRFIFFQGKSIMGRCSCTAESNTCGRQAYSAIGLWLQPHDTTLMLDGNDTLYAFILWNDTTSYVLTDDIAKQHVEASWQLHQGGSICTGPLIMSHSCQVYISTSVENEQTKRCHLQSSCWTYFVPFKTWIPMHCESCNGCHRPIVTMTTRGHSFKVRNVITQPLSLKKKNYNLILIKFRTIIGKYFVQCGPI